MVTRAILVLAVVGQTVVAVAIPETPEPVVPPVAMVAPAVGQRVAIPATLVQQVIPAQTVLVQAVGTPAQTEPLEIAEPQATKVPLVQTGLRVQMGLLVQAPSLVVTTLLQAVRLVLVEREEQVV